MQEGLKPATRQTDLTTQARDLLPDMGGAATKHKAPQERKREREIDI